MSTAPKRPDPDGILGHLALEPLCRDDWIVQGVVAGYLPMAQLLPPARTSRNAPYTAPTAAC